MVSGRKTNFLVSPPIHPGAKLIIQIKENKRGYEFGVILAIDYYPQIGSPAATALANPETKTFTTLMFDCMIVDVERFKIWGSYGDYNAAAIKFDQTEKVLQNTRIKHYLEEGRVNKKDIIDIVKRLCGITSL